MNAIAPIPRADVGVRDATLADVPFIDRLQKMHGRQVGFMRTSWIEAKIAKGEVIVAEENLTTDYTDNTDKNLDLNSSVPSVKSVVQPLGYCMGVDRYFKRDDTGIIHQLNVMPGKQRGFVGATLLKAMFDRAAYGCRLFCCWCAQDLDANRFWESTGFVPLAFRAGSEKKARVHIFWQKRIRSGDTTTQWWFPAKTDGGVMRADRIVLPIPPGKHWSDEMPVVFIETAKPQAVIEAGAMSKPLAGSQRAPKSPMSAKDFRKVRPRQFDGPSAGPEPEPVIQKPTREKKPKVKADPKLIAAARELRDRWLEHVNAGEMLLEGAGKYDVSRALPAPAQPALLLPAA